MVKLEVKCKCNGCGNEATVEVESNIPFGVLKKMKDAIKFPKSFEIYIRKEGSDWFKF